MEIPPELNKKVHTSISLILALVIGAFVLGGMVTKVLNQSDEIEFLKRYIDHEVQECRIYVEQEVGGLRSDWERRNEVVREQINDLKK